MTKKNFSIKYIQSKSLLEERLLDQFKNKKVDSGQFYGGSEMAERWEKCSSQNKMIDVGTISLDREYEKLLVVDLGPGTGIPCTQITKLFKERIQGVIGIDVSEAILLKAMKKIGTNYHVVGILADFIRDADKIKKVLDEERQNKLFLILGNTVGNYNQSLVFTTLSSFLNEKDRAIIGLRLYKGKEKIQELADFFISKENCRFGTYFLEACGMKEDYENNFSIIKDDPQEEGVKVIECFHRFKYNQTLTVSNKRVAFKKGDVVQFLESRQYNDKLMPKLLKKYGLELIITQVKKDQALYLCKTLND